MDMMTAGVAHDTIRVNIEKCENGFSVEVIYPFRLCRRPDPVGMDTILGAFAKKFQGGEDALSPESILQTASESISKAKEMEKARPLRKPVEKYVFADMAKMLEFLKEIMTSDDASA